VCITFNLNVDFIWLMSNGIVSDRISTVVSAIVTHLHITEQQSGTMLQEETQAKTLRCAAPRTRRHTYQLSPVKDWTASRRCCRAATGGNDSAAAAATSPAYGAGGTGTEAAAEATSSESSSDTGAEEAAAESASAAASMSGVEDGEVVEKSRRAARWRENGRGSLVSAARDPDGRRRAEGSGGAGCD
jgi:hypothetical protein